MNEDEYEEKLKEAETEGKWRDTLDRAAALADLLTKLDIKHEYSSDTSSDGTSASAYIIIPLKGKQQIVFEATINGFNRFDIEDKE